MSSLPQTGVYAGFQPFKASPCADSIHYETRKSLPPVSLGTLRRRRKGATCAGPQGRAGAKRPSLDTSNQLETSLLFWLQTPETPRDEHTRKKRMQDVLEISCGKIVADLERQLNELDSREPGPELDKELDRIRKELKGWTRTWERLSNCQSEWIGYRATCCTATRAIPIGCNHRGCFLCNSKRLQKYRERIKTLFGRMEHGVLLTLTVPNTAKISKRTFSTLRRGWNTFKKTQTWMEGGVYALETTYRKSNQPETPWHTHLHALASSATTLPQCKCGSCNRCGRWIGAQRDQKSVCRCGGHAAWRWHRYDDSGKWAKCHAAECSFVRFKRRIEFDWFIATGGRKQRWSPASFNQWFNRTEPNHWRNQSDFEQWNSTNRRVVFIQRVANREKACFEVIKYVTKTADFAHDHHAVKEYFTASKGARMLQTFGSWYGLKLDPDVNKGMPSAENNWGSLKCDCGKNEFERFGKVYSSAVKMDKSGMWLLRDEIFKDRRTESPPIMEAVQNGYTTERGNEQDQRRLGLF